MVQLGAFLCAFVPKYNYTYNFHMRQQYSYGIDTGILKDLFYLYSTDQRDILVLFSIFRPTEYSIV